jgi:phospholipid transport system transporter-binding protein
MMIDTSVTPYRVNSAMVYATAAELFVQGQELIAQGGTIFDFAGVTAADSSALAVILGWQRTGGDGGLLLTNLPENIRSLAELYGIADMLAVTEIS